jgi:asparagine synthase (glutamine-hydrolysing)
MCGICGFNWGDNRLVLKMNEAQKHRGPDAGGSFVDGNVSLGHRRLAIIDLSERGKQPMSNKEGTVTIVFNGEIYNFQELRDDLEKKGYRFKSGSDTEVIIHSYSEYGPDCVKKFNGMWAFCIYDSIKKSLFLSRDRIGKKPLYFYFDKKTSKFIFASELKAILEHDLKREIDETALELYLSLGFIPEPYSIFKNIRKLGQRQNLVLDLKTMKMKISTYWELPAFSPEKDKKKMIAEWRP